ncbi:MAG: glycoside hydrolase family 16 protein, partial [Paludibacteraceae bacterium]|nr:glycoside hydrolase family 16 protein [Paludibacteraceae bacterium]
MKMNLKKVLAVLALCMVSAGLSAQYDGYTLVWSDEFNGGYANPDGTTGLDMDAWSFETGGGGWGTGQRDYATRDRENVEVSNGTLKIRTRRDNTKNPEYTSGRINSQNKKSFLYGKIEARIRTVNMTESGRGFAFWMMPNGLPAGQASLAWPQGGEIDIFEYNGLYPRYNLGSVHYCWGWNNNQWAGNGQHAQASNVYDYVDRSLEYNSAGRDGCNGRNNMSTSKANLLGADWHVYGINWYNNRIEFYVDQDVYHVFRIDMEEWCGIFEKVNDKVKVTTGWNYETQAYNNYWRTFENPFYIILSAGVGGGGTYGGDIVNGNNPNQWTCTTEIDWVRCYKRNDANPPMISLKPKTNANGTVTVTPTVTSGNAIAKIEYIKDAVPEAATLTNAPFTYTFTPNNSFH